MNLKIDRNIIEIFKQRYDSIVSYEDSVGRLAIDLEIFKEKIESYTDHNEFFDQEQALYLHDLALKIIEYCRSNLGHPDIPYLLAAVSYLVEEKDAQDDFATLDGLDDDQVLLEAVLKELNIGPLIAQLDKSEGE